MPRDKRSVRRPLKPITGLAAEFPEERHSGKKKKGVVVASFNKGGAVKKNTYAKG